MKLDILIIQLGVLFLPGLIWARLDSQYAMKAKPSDTEYFLRAFQFGLVSYGATYVVYWLVGWKFNFLDLSDAGSKYIIDGNFVPELLIAILVGLLLSLVWIYSSTYKLLSRFLQKIKATYTYGDEDVWDYTFNSKSPRVEYIHFRDFEHNIVYAGWVLTYSESEKLRELVLRDVNIYDFDGALLFEMPMIYIARAPENIHIEFPFKP